MKLRHRLALAFAITGTATLVLSRIVTMDAFRRVQEYDLDEGLKRRARQESSEVALLGRKAFETQAEEDAETNPLEHLVTYGALYDADGNVAADTPSFAHAPSLHEIGLPARPKVVPPSAPFDFRFRGSDLRGVLVEVKTGASSGPQYLLLAASRREMDVDARQLIEVGWWVLFAMIPVALGLGAWLGRRMTHGIESVAAAARRVTDGDLETPIAHDLVDVVARDDEVAALATALREMIGRLKELLEIERRFASHAAHELRSPLAALRGELELALRRKRSPEEYEQTLRDVLDDTNRLIALSEDLLTVARLGGQSRDVEEEVALGDALSEAIASSLAAGKLAPPSLDETVRVRGSRAAIVRMFRNLLDNGVTHGDASTLRVDGSRDAGGTFRIVVEDDGGGVAEEDRPRVFEHFHRGADAREHSGAGLGLGIAREVARQHGGDLELASASKPTRFVVTLPLVSGALRQTSPSA